MSLSSADIQRIARLARIAVTPAEIDATQHKLNSILGMISDMQSVNTDDVVPMAHPQDSALRLRDDQVTETNRREALLAVAPQTEAQVFLVPRVIE
jgi:aspartyl-tRNA(Asn)/glutamyl-tRNA(Gln) amidotransferase subunit C